MFSKEEIASFIERERKVAPFDCSLSNIEENVKVVNILLDNPKLERSVLCARVAIMLDCIVGKLLYLEYEYNASMGGGDYSDNKSDFNKVKEEILKVENAIGSLPEELKEVIDYTVD